MRDEITTYPHDGHERKVAVFYDLGRYRELLDMARPMMVGAACSEEVFAHAADAAVELEEFTEARTILDAALTVYPRSVRLLGVRIRLLIILGLHRGALEVCAAALEIEPENDAVWYCLAVVRYNMHDLAGAMQAIETALELNPADAGYLALRAEILWTRDKNGLALEVARQGLALAPDNQHLLMLLATLEKKSAGKRKILKDLLRINPLHAEGRAEYEKLTGGFRFSCVMAGLATLTHVTLRAAVEQGYLPGVTGETLHGPAMAMLAVIGLFMARGTGPYLRLSFLFVACNLEISWLGDNLKDGFRRLVVGVVMACLLGFLFAWLMFFVHHLLLCSIQKPRQLLRALLAARNSGCLRDWLLEMAGNRHVWLVAAGGIVLGLAALIDPTKDGYVDLLLTWLALLVPLLYLTTAGNLAASFGGAVVCLICSLPFSWLVQAIPPGLAWNVGQCLTAFFGGCLATSLGWWVAAGWGDD